MDRKVEDPHREELAAGAIAHPMMRDAVKCTRLAECVLRFLRAGEERRDRVHSDVVGRAGSFDLADRRPAQQHRVTPVRADDVIHQRPHVPCRARCG